MKKIDRMAATSEIFETGDFVDVVDSGGAWWEAALQGAFVMTEDAAFERVDLLEFDWPIKNKNIGRFNVMGKVV